MKCVLSFGSRRWRRSRLPSSLRYSGGGTDIWWSHSTRSFDSGVDLRGRWDTMARVWVYADQWRVAEPATDPVTFREIPKNQLCFTLQMSPSHALSQVVLEGVVGEEIDYDNARPGDGATLTLGATVRPTDHLALRLDASRRWIDVRPPGGGAAGRLLTASTRSS